MTTDARISAPHLVLGVCFMALGVALLLDRLGILPVEETMAYWPLALVLLGGSLVVQAIRAPGAPGPGFPIGGVIWLVLIAVVVAHVFERRTPDPGGGDRLSVFAMLSGDRRVMPSGRFRGADVTSVMGGTVLDLRQVTIDPGQDAVVDVFTLMGGGVIHVPRDWVVVIETTSLMGGVRDERLEPPRRRGRIGDAGDLDDPAPVEEQTGRPAPPPPAGADTAAPEAAEAAGPARLVVRGFVMMGGLVIRA